MADLPSYQEATSQDWLSLVGPYLGLKDYSRLCLVSKAFYEHFAPRLWKNPLTAVRALGLNQGDDLPWYFGFLKHMRSVRRGTAALVLVLDFRGFAPGVSDYYSAPAEWDVSQTFQHFPFVFPNLRCVLLDGHPEFKPAMLTKQYGTSKDASVRPQPLYCLSAVQCRTQLPANFFRSPYLADVVYLDLSYVPGSIANLAGRAADGSRSLPRLRVLKLRGRELDDRTAALLLQAFRTQLWSLDLGHNNLTDAVVDTVLAECFPGHVLRSAAHFATEGSIVYPDGAGCPGYGPFTFISESDSSADFSHAARYFADAPSYASATSAPTPENVSVRSEGRGQVLQDTAESVLHALCGDVSKRQDATEMYTSLVGQRHGAVTHLHLDTNRFSASGIQRLVRLSPGHLEHLDCGSVALRVDRRMLAKWLASAKLQGFVGGAHLFRPVTSSNLRILRVHHSLVTQTPTLEAEGLSKLSSTWLAETYFRRRVELAYPQAFVPDMNPRLYSLTLTNIPRYSTGSIIRKLTNLIRLAATQERAITEATVSSLRRAPSMLRGLRHIRLEFDPDPKEEPSTISDGDVFDSEALANMAAKEFSFFGETGWASPSSPDGNREQRASRSELPLTHGNPVQDTETPAPGGQLKHSPFAGATGQHVEYSSVWDGKTCTIPVWIGPGILGQNEAVNEYMRLLRHPDLRSNVIPASPGHVAAGVPTGSYIFGAAWDAMLAPEEVARPTKAQLDSMRDVLADIKEYRRGTKAAFTAARLHGGSNDTSSAASHPHWTGQLEIALNHSATHFHSSRYWR